MECYCGLFEWPVSEVTAGTCSIQPLARHHSVAGPGPALGSTRLRSSRPCRGQRAPLARDDRNPSPDRPRQRHDWAPAQLASA